MIYFAALFFAASSNSEIVFKPNLQISMSTTVKII